MNFQNHQTVTVVRVVRVAVVVAAAVPAVVVAVTRAIKILMTTRHKVNIKYVHQIIHMKFMYIYI